MTTPNNPNPGSNPNPGGQWGQQPNPQQPPQQPPHQPQWGSQPQQPGQPQPQWGNQPNPQAQPQQQPYPPQWGNQPTPQQPQQQPYPPQWGTPQGQPQWGAPNPQQPQQPQWGNQPHPQPQWGGQPPVNNGGQKQFSLPSWPTFVMGGILLLTFITSFFTAFRFYAELEDFGGWGGSVGGRINWWGSLTPETTGLGRLGETQMLEEYGSTGFLYGFGTVVILGCYIAATVLYFLGKEKLGALLGIIASGVQLLYTFLVLVGVSGTEENSLGAAWWMWLLFAVIALPLSIFLFIKGTAGVEGQFAKTKSSLQEAQARSAQKRQAQKQANPANQQPAQSQQQWNTQQPQQPQQSGSTAVKDTPSTSDKNPETPNDSETNNPTDGTN